jgi:hypothetical protein
VKQRTGIKKGNCNYRELEYKINGKCNFRELESKRNATRNCREKETKKKVRHVTAEN